MKSPAAQTLFSDLVCASCGASELQSAGERVICAYCGAPYADAGTLCVNCGHVNRLGAEYCEQCGDPLSRACPTCRAQNWSGAETCANCGQPLALLDYLSQRQRQTTADSLNRARQEARVIKEQENEAAQRRSAALWAIERERQRELAAAALRQQARDRATVRLILATLIIFGLAVVVAGALLAAR